MKRLTIGLALFLGMYAVHAQKAIYVEKSGKGNPIIFLPGFISPGSVWNETIQKLKGKNENHVVSYAGFNGLDPIDTPWYDALKKDLIEYISTNKLTNVTIVGHSMGGNLAIDIAAALPLEISQLIIVESIPCMRELMMPGVTASSIQYESPYNKQLLQMEDEPFKQMAVNMSKFMVNDSTKAVDIANWTIEADRETYVYGYTDLLKLDLRENLLSVKARTLILGAPFPEKSEVLMNYEKQYANLKSKEILIAESGKHFIMFDQPVWVAERMNNFLGKK